MSAAALALVVALAVVVALALRRDPTLPELRRRLLFGFSQIGYALACDVCYTSRIAGGYGDDPRHVARLKTGDSVFISVSETRVSVARLVSILRARGIRLVFYLMAEPEVPRALVEALAPVAARMFVQNNAYDAPNVHAMPIGIRDCGTVVEVHRGSFEQRTLLDALGPPRAKKRKCVLCFSVGTHESRRTCYETLKDAPFVLDLNRASGGWTETSEFYAAARESMYTLAPRGFGVDTHRFYEAIFLWSVPIVVRTGTAFDRVYAQFPCLVVEAWSDVTEPLLDGAYEACARAMRAFHARYPRVLFDPRTATDLMLRL